MATKPENQFRLGVHKYLPVGLHHEKMCNPYSSGTPDDWYSGMGSDLWVEYKFLPRLPLRASVKPASLLSVLQLKWLTERHVEGRNVAMVIGCSTGGYILINQEWLVEIPADKFREGLVPRKAIAQWIVRETSR